MITRRRTNESSSQSKLLLQKQSAKAPEDIVDLDQQISLNELPLEAKYALFDYFTHKDGSLIIKNWSKLFSIKNEENEMQAYQELLSLILQLSGNRIEMGNNQLESNSFDTVLNEFIQKVEKSKQCPPLYKFLKAKSNKIIQFWNEISESLITNNVFKSNNYKHFMEWISAFNNCKIRVVRLSSSLFICSLFESLANSISWRKDEITKFQGKSKTKTNNQQLSLFEQEIELYSSIANDLFKNLFIARFRDIDEQIRNAFIKSLTNAAITSDTEFFDEQKLKYIGRALNDTSPINRLAALNSCEKIVSLINKETDNENDNHQISNKRNKIKNKSFFPSAKDKDQIYIQVHAILTEFSEMYSPRIIEMCNDSNEEVCAEAISCLEILIDKRLINQDECQNVHNLITDDSPIIRKAAANFIAKRLFINNENNDSLDHFLLFAQNFDIKNGLPFVVSSLYPYLKCLKKWDEMCDKLMAEENDDQSIIISAILLYSSKIALSQVDDIEKRSNSKYKNSQDSIDIEKAMKKARKLSSILIQNLPQLLKAYQSSKGKEIILNLVELSGLLDPNAISENSSEKQYEKLLNQLHEIFVKCDQSSDKNTSLFNATFNSIYLLSQNNSQLSEIAQKELDKLSLIFSNFGLSGEDENENEEEEERNENINNILAKFSAAAKLVDISANEKLKKKILHELCQKMKKYDSSSQSDGSAESDQDDEENDEKFICNSIECLQYYFKWDVKKVHDFLVNRKVSEEEVAEITEKIEKMKEPYISEFHELSTIFSSFLRSEKSSFNIKLSAFKSLAAIISFSPIITYETASGLSPPFISAPIVNDRISDSFFSFYHEIKSFKMKNELFDTAELPIIVKAIDIGYSAHLFVYNFIENKSSDEISNQDSEYINELTEKVKKFWKNMSQFRPINGKQLYSAFSFIIENFPNIKSSDLRRIARFFVGKFKVADFIKEWSESKDEDEIYLPIAVTFLFGLNQNEASQLKGSLSDRFSDVIDKISAGNKITSKDIMKIQVGKKLTKKKENYSYFSIIDKSKKRGQKITKKQLFDGNDNSSDLDQVNNDDDDNAIIIDEIEVIEDSDEDQIENNCSPKNDYKSNEGSENDDQNEYDDSDVQEIGYNNNNHTSDSQESEIEFEEPDETFVFRS